MKKSVCSILLVLVLLLSFSFVGINTAVVASADTTYDTTVSLGSIPSETLAQTYGALVKDGITIQAYAGFFNADNASNNYDLVKFDGGSGNSLTCSAKPNFTFENWKYTIGATKASVVIEITATKAGTLVFDTSASTNFGGWLDWNSAYIVRLLKNDGTLSNIVYDYHIGSGADTTIKGHYANGFTQELAKGDKIYIELGADGTDNTNSRNFQNMQDSTINFTKFVPTVNSNTVTFNDIHYYQLNYDYEPVVANGFKFQAYAGFFNQDAAANNFDLVKFDTKVTEEDGTVVSCSSKSGLSFKSWKYVSNNNSVVFSFEALKDGVFDVDFSTCNVGGWIDWNSAYIVRLLKKDGSLSNIFCDYHIDNAEASIKADIAKGLFVPVNAGDKVFIEFGSSADRNIQNLNNASVTFYELTANKANALATITEANNKVLDVDYTSEDYNAIKDLYNKNYKLIYKATSDGENALRDEFLNKIENTKTYVNFFDIPYFVNANNFGYYNGKFISYSAFTGTARNLIAFNTAGENVSTCTSAGEVEFRNWQYTFTADNGVIIAIKANKDVKVNLYKDNDTFGYMDDSLYNVYLASNGKVYLLSSTEKPTSKDVVNKSYYLKTGDVLYLEFIAKDGVEGTRNYQLGNAMNLTAFTDFTEEAYNTQNAIISIIEAKISALNTYVGALKEADYTASSWAIINGYVSEFNNKVLNLLTEEEIVALLTKAEADIDAVLTIQEIADNFAKYKTDALATLKAYYDGLLENNHYTATAKQSLLDIYNQAVTDFEALDTNEKVDQKVVAVKALLDAVEQDALYDSKLGIVASMNDTFNALFNTDYTAEDYQAIKDLLEKNIPLIYDANTFEAVNTLKEEFLNKIENTKTYVNFFDIPYFVNANSFGYKNGKFISYSAFTGKTRSLVALDTKVSDNMITSTQATNVVFENWQYVFTADNAVIIAIKANKDVKVNLNKDNDTFGYMDDSLYNVYLASNGKVYLLSSTEKPTSKDVINKSYYLKTGDVLYLEFIAKDGVEGTRNYQLGNAMNLTAFTDFTEEAYNTQNAIISIIEAKISALNTYVGALKEADYTASSWAIINGYVSEFNNKVLNLLTEEQIVALLTKAEADIDAVLTIQEIADNFATYKTDSLKALKDYYDALLKDNHYTATAKQSLLDIYNQAVTDFEALDTMEKVDNKLTTTKNALDAVAKDTLYSEKETELNKVNEAFNKINKAYYSEEAYNAVETKVNTFIANIDTFTSAQEIANQSKAVIDAINALVPEKEGVNYLDMPLAIYNNNYEWVEGVLFNYTARTGNVSDGLVKFDTYTETDNTISSSKVKGMKMSNWMWTIMPKNGVILIYKANSDIKLSIVDTRITNGSGTNGWTDDCLLKYYIVREDVVKEIKTIAKPTTDADFSGDFYLKSGDILYVEFNAPYVNADRNTQAPYGTAVVASNDFNEALYIEQNHDLSAEVKEQIRVKTQELTDYVNGLSEDNYSSSNWENITDYLNKFIDEIEDNVSTVEEVNTEAAKVLENIQAVQTIEQANAELTEALISVKQALQDAYFELVNNNNYSEENKVALDKLYNDALTEIESAKSKVQANSIKVKAVQSMNALEKETKDTDKKGCSSSLGGTFIVVLIMSLAIVGVELKKKKMF